MITIDVLRHASTEWNELGRMQGRRDVPLSDAGRAQAAAWRVEPVEGCVDWCTSPLQRATQTARLAVRDAGAPTVPEYTVFPIRRPP